MTRATAEPNVHEVDTAVRSVLANLYPSRNSQPRPTPDDSLFQGRLLSLRHAEALSPGTRSLRVAQGTVITPLARDALKRLGIGVRLVAKAEIDGGRNHGQWGFSIESQAMTGIVEAFRRSLLENDDAWSDLGASVDAAARWVTSSQSRGALMLAENASLAVYRGCRFQGGRAAQAVDAESTSRAVRALGANLLVVEPAGKPIALLKQIAAAFRRHGTPVAPEGIDRADGGQS